MVPGIPRQQATELPTAVIAYQVMRQAETQALEVPKSLEAFDVRECVPCALAAALQASPSALLPVVTSHDRGLYTFDCLQPQVCAEVLAQWHRLEASGIPKVDPSLYTSHGALCADMGMLGWCAGLVRDVLSPIARALWPGAVLGRGLDPQDCLPFVLGPGAEPLPWHEDPSVITFNVCLAAEGVPAVNFATGTDVGHGDPVSSAEGTMLHRRGAAAMHLGSRMHRSGGQGGRSTLVVYCVPRLRGARLTPPFYARYEHYLGQKYEKQQRHERRLPQAFDVPLLPAWCLRVLAALEARDAEGGMPRETAGPGALPPAPGPVPAVLPPEVLLEVWHFLPHWAKAQAQLVCRSWFAGLAESWTAAQSRLWAKEKAMTMGGGCCSDVPCGGREVVCLHLGGAGVRLGAHVWEAFCLESGIDTDGTAAEAVGCPTFAGGGHGPYTPRAVFTDLDPSSLQNLRAGPWGCFDGHSFVGGQESAGYNFALGEALGKVCVDQVLEQVRAIAEGCAGLQGFMLFHSLGGGTGSGFTSLLLERYASSMYHIGRGRGDEGLCLGQGSGQGHGLGQGYRWRSCRGSAAGQGQHKGRVEGWYRQCQGQGLQLEGRGRGMGNSRSRALPLPFGLV